MYIQMRNNLHASLQADAFKPVPQHDGAAPAPAAPAALAPAAPADAGDITGGRVVTAKEQKQKVHDVLFASSTDHFCKAQVTVQVLVMLSSIRQTAACFS